MKDANLTSHRPQRGLLASNSVPADFCAFIASDRFTCVGARSALALGLLDVFEAGELASGASDLDLYRALCEFSARQSSRGSVVASFACLFRADAVLSERDFEAALWSRLQALHDFDAARGVDWAPDVAREPGSREFSFSVGGDAYFVVGLHPGASRPARRFCRPALVFNAHAQFEELRKDGRYDRIQTIVRAREIARHGSINPMLTDFGRGREAAQYSGRFVPPDWSCPLRVRS